MTDKQSKDLFDSGSESSWVNLEFLEDAHRYTPEVDEEIVVELANEFGVSAEQIIYALRRWWHESVLDQLKAFHQRLDEVRWDTDAATHFAQRFL